MAGRSDSGSIVDVLQPNWDTVQRTLPVPSGDLGLRGLCIGQRFLTQHHEVGIEVAVQRLDTSEECLGEFDR